MKIIKFSSGLGNQIYIYLMYLYLKDVYPHERFYGYYNKSFLSKHYGLEVDKVFDITMPPKTLQSDIVAFFCRSLRKVLPSIISTDKNFNIGAVYFDGYWQKKEYLKFINCIHFRDLDVGLVNEKLKVEIQSCYSISLHIRRGDYYSPQFSSIYANICTLRYYQNAINFMITRHPQAVFYVFSDDINWAKENLKAENIKYVDNNRKEKSYIDMYLMSLCKSNIIANSSFSFWAAMLNRNDEKIVVYPEKWKNDECLPDVFPSDWVKMKIK